RARAAKGKKCLFIIVLNSGLIGTGPDWLESHVQLRAPLRVPTPVYLPTVKSTVPRYRASNRTGKPERTILLRICADCDNWRFFANLIKAAVGDRSHGTADRPAITSSSLCYLHLNQEAWRQCLITYRRSGAQSFNMAAGQPRARIPAPTPFSLLLPPT